MCLLCAWGGCTIISWRFHIYPGKLNFVSVITVQYVGMCVLSLPISLMIIVRTCALYIIIIKSEVRPICYCLGLGNETMVYAVCLSVFWSGSSRQSCVYFRKQSIVASMHRKGNRHIELRSREQRFFCMLTAKQTIPVQWVNFSKL